MDYFKYQISTDTLNNEVLIALMSVYPFDTFVENVNGFEAYIPYSLEQEEITNFLSDLQGRFEFSFIKEFIKGENWNEEWEKNFNPIQVEDFCGIRAAFHQPIKGVEHELIITPKMAFGTGHHETTYMVIQMMRELDFQGKMVFDYGCGTGVLAILASKLGAVAIDAIDIEEASYQNTIENCETNNVDNVHAIQGTINLVEHRSYGIVLANINRNVILDSLDPLLLIMETGGNVVFSGFIRDDEQLMKRELAAKGFVVQKTLTKNNWLAMHCIKA